MAMGAFWKKSISSASRALQRVHIICSKKRVVGERELLKKNELVFWLVDMSK